MQTEDAAVKVRVIADEALDAHAIIETRTPIFYLHFTTRPGAKVVQPIPKEYNSFVYIINGESVFGPAEKQKAANAGQMVIFDNDGGEVVVANASTDNATTDTTNKPVLEILLIGGSIK